MHLLIKLEEEMFFFSIFSTSFYIQTLVACSILSVVTVQ